MALDGTPGSGMRGLLDRQKAAHLRDGIPSAAKRIEWLDKSIDLLATHGDALNDAMCSDFGHRSKDQSNLTDIAGSIGAILTTGDTRKAIGMRRVSPAASVCCLKQKHSSLLKWAADCLGA